MMCGHAAPLCICRNSDRCQTPVFVPPLCRRNHPNKQVKGRTLLVGASSCSAEELLAVAEASAAGTALWKVKRQMKRAEARTEKAARKAGGGRGRE